MKHTGARTTYIAAVSALISTITFCLMTCTSSPSELPIPQSEPPMPMGGLAVLNQNVDYPERAREAGIEGTVIIRAFIDSTGKVTETSVFQGMPHKDLNQAAVEAVENTSWKPAKKAGVPVGVRVIVPIQFPPLTIFDNLIGSYDEPPRPSGGPGAIQKNIEYPRALKRNGIEGTVVVQFFIDETGEVKDMLIVKGAHPNLNYAAMEAIRKTPFIPARLEGNPVGIWMSFPIKFDLK